MKKAKPIPLAERLRSMDASRPLGAFLLYTDDYFEGLAHLAGSDFFIDIYRQEFERHNLAYGKNKLLDEFAYHIQHLAPEKRAQLLHWMLIEPFLRMKERREPE